ncbi:putative nuclease HARBI1 [Ostrea edulis]|uniref:putative nuclease HARBI1 n=1 Tax=Ostrea edulis TaxID=37623 RepID=UPI0024AFB621|nr:putative nuclease HARBI1 [Ostrea edulis]
MAGRRRRRRRFLRYRNRPSKRVIRDRLNPLETYTDDELFERYRFRQASVVYLLDLIGGALIDSTKINALPPLLQLFVCLRFFATGAYHKLIGDSINVSESTVGRCCRSVTDAILRVRQQFIVFPRDAQARKTKQEFIKIAGFPNTLGCGDGTFIRIIAPSENEPDFVNRKGFHSLNVQMVCDTNFKFTSVCASWPGSVHDSRIWRESSLCRQFERGEHNGILLGDSGYPCRRFLMTPYLNPQTNTHQRFNASLCRTRVLIEQSFGILKRRFSCLHGTLRTTPEQAVAYVVACVILHNLSIETGDVMDRQDQPMGAFDQTAHQVAYNSPEGSRMRDYIAQTYFG